MRRKFPLLHGLWAAAAVTALLPVVPVAHAGGEIHGTIRTTEGETLRGSIRWDRNEVFWDDLLNATRREAVKKEEGKREFSMSIFGVRLGGQQEFTHHSVAIPFGHLRSLEPIPGGEARLSLKNGTDMVVRAGSTDIGARMRELIIDDEEKGAVNLRWESIGRVDFAPGPGPGRDGERLYGKVVTRDGAVEGFIVFDRDLALADDLLRGAKDAEKPIRLGDVSRLEPLGGRAVRVTLGAEQPPIEVREAQRTLDVCPPGVGTVEIDWDDVESVDFSKPPASPRYETFDGGKRLAGTVHLRGGKTRKGEIVWDRDEVYTFDALDGEIGGLDYSIPFANIRTIKRKSSRSSEIVLAGGGKLELSGTNDVNDENRGIIVHLADGTARELEWDEIDRVEFHGASTPAPGETRK